MYIYICIHTIIYIHNICIYVCTKEPNIFGLIDLSVPSQELSDFM